MGQIIGCGILIVILILIFCVLSYATEQVFHVHWTTLSERVLFGFLSYFICFQIIALPLILLHGTLTLLIEIWLSVLGVLLGITLIVKYKNIIGDIRDYFHEKKSVMVVCMMGLVCLAILFSVVQIYNGWDTAFYLGGMNTSLATDTFYLYDGHTGEPQSGMNLHYVLSTFYVQFTVWCKVLHIQTRIMAFYGMRALCIILSSMSIYWIGRKLFCEDRKKASLLVVLWLLFQYCATTIYSPASFLFVRGYEAKGYCANVVLPLLMFTLIRLLGEKDITQQWKELAIIAFASVPISMSAVAIVPFAVGIMALVMIAKTKKVFRVVGYSFCCVLPNLCYLVCYILNVKGIIVVRGV